MTTVDTHTTDSLVERLFNAVLATMDVQAAFLGERLGYYRALAAGGALTSAALAARTGTAERYTREWLEQQAVTGILVADDEPDAARRRYTLPPGHAVPLADELSPDFILPLAKFVAGAGKRLDALVEAYRTGGGVSWAEHGTDVREAQAAANRPMFLGDLGSTYLPSIPDVDAALRAGGRVADIGCGHGWSAIGIALAYPAATVDGYDVDGPSIEAARRTAADAGVGDRVRFHALDPAEAVAAGERYDAVFAFECVHDLPDPVGFLATARALAADTAPVVIMDERVADVFTAPGDDIERLMYGYSLLCCLADGMAHPDSAATGTVMRHGTLREYAVRAGFADAHALDVENDFFRFYRLTH
ncbi:MAG: class I SAM-dependent methyltransferase [Pseudonocardia sp.]